MCAVVSANTEKAVETFVRREDAERFLEEVRRDDAELAERLRVQPVELDAGQNSFFRKGDNGQIMRADAQTEAALLDILERFCSGFAAQDAGSIVQLFARDPDVAMVTSEESLLRGPAEVSAFLQRYAQGTTRYSWTWDRRDASAAGAVGWVLAEGTETAAAEEREEKHPYRMSMVCEKRDGRWHLVQVHGSSPHHS
jgi:hypothetical protein